MVTKTGERGAAVIWRRRSCRQAGQARSKKFGRVLVLACLALLSVSGGYASAMGPEPIPAPRGGSLHPETVPLRPTTPPRQEPAQPSRSDPRRAASLSGSSSTSAAVGSTDEETDPVEARASRPAKARESSRAGQSTRKSLRRTVRKAPRTSARPKPTLGKPPARSNRIAAPAFSAKPVTSPDRSLLLAGGLMLVAFVFGHLALLVLSGAAAMSARGDE
jgi:hypothetical protein